jgi:hypothetical protein
MKDLAKKMQGFYCNTWSRKKMSKEFLENTIVELKQELKQTREHRDRLLDKVIKLSKKPKKPVLKLEAKNKLELLLHTGYCIKGYPCEKCPLHFFSTIENNCMENAKLLLELLD